MECRGARKAWGEIHQRGSRGPGQHTERDKGGREGEWELGQKGGGGVGGNGCARGGVSSTRHRKTSTTHRGKSCVLVGGGAGGGWRVVRGLGMGEGGGVILGARDAESWRVLSTRQRRTWTTHGEKLSYHMPAGSSCIQQHFYPRAMQCTTRPNTWACKGHTRKPVRH